MITENYLQDTMRVRHRGSRVPIRSVLSSADEPFSACSREFLLRTDLGRQVFLPIYNSQNERSVEVMQSPEDREKDVALSLANRATPDELLTLDLHNRAALKSGFIFQANEHLFEEMLVAAKQELILKLPKPL